MKKTASFFLLATLALVSAPFAQAAPQGNTNSTSGSQPEGVFGGPLGNAHRASPSPSAAAATDNGGKKTIGDAVLAADEKGKNATTSFPAGTTSVYLVTKNVSGAKGDKVMAEWYADDAGKTLPKGKRFYNSAIELPNTSSYNPSFHVTGPGNKALPAGKYHVDLSVGGEKLKSAKFSVQ